MKRKEFLKSTCALGMCTCAGISLFNNGNVFPQSNEDSKDEKDWKLGFIQRRFAKLLEIVGSSVDKDELNMMLEKLGRECAKENKEFYIKFKGDPEGLIEELKKNWIEAGEFNKGTNTIRIIGKKTDSCFCPFVDKSLTPKEFCNCSMGYNKEVFETVTGKSVKVNLEESVLHDGQRCSCSIEII
jgi:predicted ArsR family transcriptional regulator